ncbi:MAG: hypothetical protein EAZ53_08290 [Bacteroidetes bacterium]|nr:MAG: hypothetical protein EAZ53_08290 [Bacteroidota bacterium]
MTNKKIGTITFFFTNKKFGSIKINEKEYLFNSTFINFKKDDIILINIIPSLNLSSEKIMLDDFIHLTNDNVISYFGKFDPNENKYLINKFPDAFERLISDKLLSNIHEISIKANNIVLNFDSETYSRLINAKIITQMTKKFGEDDSFFAMIISSYPQSEDPYLKKINPSFAEKTYGDSGFYSCYSMADDYDRSRRAKDEIKIIKIKTILKKEFLDKYSPESHLNELIESFSIDFKKDLLTKYINGF